MINQLNEPTKQGLIKSPKLLSNLGPWQNVAHQRSITRGVAKQEQGQICWLQDAIVCQGGRGHEAGITLILKIMNV